MSKPTEDQLHQTKLLLGDPQAKAKEVIKQEAANVNMSYARLMEEAANYLETGEDIYTGEDQVSFNDDAAFWAAYQTVTETVVEPDKQYSFFRCAC